MERRNKTRNALGGALIVPEDMDVVHEDERISNLGKRKNGE